MMRRIFFRTSTWLCALGQLSLASIAKADIVYNESVDGDASTDHLNPTPLALSYGVNSVLLTTGFDDLGNYDLDYLRLDLPAGGTLANMFLESYTGSTVSFFGFQAGSALTFDPELSGGFDCFDFCLGFSHFGPDASSFGGDVGGDLFAAANIFGPDNGGPSFPVPLPGSQYTFFMQETGSAVSYQLDFVVIPEPTAGIVAVIALMAGALSRRRHCNARPGSSKV